MDIGDVSEHEPLVQCGDLLLIGFGAFDKIQELRVMILDRLIMRPQSFRPSHQRS